MFFDDESASCKSHVLPSTSSLKIESVKSVKRKLNTNAKVFTRSTDKEASLNESVYSVNEPPLSNFITKPNEFNSPQMVSSISQQDHQNHDFPLTAESKHLGSMYVKNTGADFKLGSKSVQHTQCENSPIKDEGFLKNKFSKNFKEFTPTYLKKGYSDHHQYNSQSMPVAPNFQANPKFNNTMEMNCFQMLQERLSAFTTNRFPPAYDQQKYYYGGGDLHQTPTKSKSVPTSVPGSDNSYPYPGQRGPYDHSELSDIEHFEESMDDGAFYDRLDKEIYKFVAEVDRQISSVDQERDILTKKIILDLCKHAFEDESIKLDVFGSIATGLALETSDIDLVVTGLKIEGRDDAISHIRTLKDHFEGCQYFSNIKAIEGASIPVIKLEADLQKLRENENSKNTSIVESEMRFLQIDITFEDSKEKKSDFFWEGFEWNTSKLHLGMKSIHLVKSYIKEYVHLKELTLCIKKLLSVRDLNSPYQGGLSSYGVIIMIVAYMNFFSLQNAWVNISQLLIHFFDFYGSKFEENKVGIMINRGG